MITKIKSKIDQIIAKGIIKTIKDFVRYHIYLYAEIVILERDLSLPTKKYKTKKQFNVQILTKESDLSIYEDQLSSQKLQVFSDHFHDGCLCVICLADKEIASYVWISTKDFYDKHLYKYNFKIKEKCIYQFDGLVFPKFRGTPVVLLIQQRAWEYYLEKRYLKTICAIDTYNLPSLRLHLRLGFKETGEVVIFRKLFFYKWSKKEIYTGQYLSSLYKEKRLDQLGSVLNNNRQ